MVMQRDKEVLAQTGALEAAQHDLLCASRSLWSCDRSVLSSGRKRDKELTELRERLRAVEFDLKKTLEQRTNIDTLKQVCVPSCVGRSGTGTDPGTDAAPH
jgi:hypothetical protein